MLIEQYDIENKWEKKAKEVKLVKVYGFEEWEIEIILNKRKKRKVIKYLVHQKKFAVENNIQEKEKNLEDVKKVVAEFKERLNTEVKRQEKLDRTKEKDFRRRELLGKIYSKDVIQIKQQKI